jgi:hypothetical protein
VRDDRWGPPVSRAQRGAKAARLEVSHRVGGGKREGRHQRVANWADRAAEWLRPSGEGGGRGKWPVEERKWRWATAGPKTEAGPNTSNKPFQFFFQIQFFVTNLEIGARRFRRDFGMGIFSKFF